MRPFEAMMGIGILAPLLLAVAPHFARASWRAASAVLLGLAGAHLLIEGWRYQAVPFYLAGAVSFIAPAHPKTMAGIIAALCLAGGIACYAVPVFTLPKPTGPYGIGSRTRYWTDEKRAEKHAPGPRRIAVEIWYPAAPSATGARGAYRDRAALLPKSDHHRLVKTYAVRDARPLAQPGGWPMVFFSPSSGGYRTQNTAVCEELASHGYVVAGVDHPYSSSRVAFPEGTVVHSLANDWLQIATQASWKASEPIVEATLETRVSDIILALENLGAQNEIPVVAGSAAVIGHSFGGAVAAELCRRDARFKAGANLDGWMFSGVRQAGVGQSFLFAIEDDPLWRSNPGPYPDNYHGNARRGTLDYHETIRRSIKRHGGYLWRPPGARHGDFSDLALYLRWPFPGQRPSDEGRVRALHTELRTLLVALCDRHLKGKVTPVLKHYEVLKEEL
jgi:dienelactone hydrolase